MNRREVLTVIGLSAASLATLRGVVAQPLATAPTWALEELYANDAVWAASADSLNGRVAELEGLVDGIGASPQRLYETLHAISEARRESLRLATYAKLAAYADLRDAEAQKRNARAEALLGRLETATVGLNPAVRDLGRQRVDIYLAANPSLAPFRHALDDMLRLAPHALPTTEAGILSSSDALFDGPQATYNQLLGSDMPHPTIVLSTGEQVLLDDSGYVRARSLPNRADRKRVFDRFWTSYNAYRNTFGAILSTQVAGDNMLARLQRYPSALDAALDVTATPPLVYHTMIAEARAGIPSLQRYLRLRQRALGQRDLHYYDMYAPLGRSERSFSPGEAREIMIESVRPLGTDYVERLCVASRARWGDLLPRPGKYAGAMTNPDAYDVHPYILLNYNPDYHGLTTYVHEWGHAMHGVLANSTQPFETSHYATFVAEIASTCNEQLLAEHMIRTSREKQEQLFYTGQLLELLRLNIFREPMLSEFEHTIHQQAGAGSPMSGASMTETYYGLLRDYHEPAMKIDRAYAVEWSFIPQFYTAYYSFQYATSIAASSHFAQELVSGNVRVRDAYLKMLSAGGSDYAYNIVRNAGVDLASPEPYRGILTRFDRLLDKLENMLA